MPPIDDFVNSLIRVTTNLAQVPCDAPVMLITGGARRVGRSVCLRMAQAGYDIAFTYHQSRTDADSLLQELRDMGRAAIAIQADLRDPCAGVASIAHAFDDAFERLDLLINNASLYRPDALDHLDLAQAREHWALHVETPMLLCRQFAPLLNRSAGCVINMVDLLAEKPWPRYLSYCASKAALWNMTLNLARSLAPRVRVNGIAPGVVQWPADMPAEEKEAYLRRVPLNRVGAPEDVAGLVHYLATTGDYLTGQIIRLDGGRSLT